MNAAQFIKIVLGVPGAVEGAHMGHADFRLNGRVFASLGSDEDFGVVGLGEDDQARMVSAWPGQFEPMGGAWGARGWTKVLFPASRAGPVREAVGLARAKAMAGRPGRRRARR